MRAIGIVRQSRGREENLSPTEQRDRIEKVCEREGLELVAVHEEIDVSGGTPLAQRGGLRAAVESIEQGEAQVVVVAYFDRLFRSLVVQAEVTERVEAAGGRILAADVGEVSGATAGAWISSGVLGMVAEYQRRSIRERSGAAQALAVAEGRPPFGQFPPGYERVDGRLVPNADAPTVRRAFALRVEGATIAEVRAFLRQQGIERSYHGVQSMLSSRLYLGELRFGQHFNPAAHEPIIDRTTFDAVQGEHRGARAKSDRLLARLGVLRCATCNARMIVGVQTSKGRRYPLYRCPPVGDCPRRVTIGAEIVEGLVVEAVKEAIADEVGRASADERVRAAEAELERAQERLDAAIRGFADLQDEPVAIDQLRELRAARDSADERLAHLGGARFSVEVTGSDWQRLTLAARRRLIRAVVESVHVAPGRGRDRVTVKLFGE